MNRVPRGVVTVAVLILTAASGFALLAGLAGIAAADHLGSPSIAYTICPPSAAEGETVSYQVTLSNSTMVAFDMTAWYDDLGTGSPVLGMDNWTGDTANPGVLDPAETWVADYTDDFSSTRTNTNTYEYTDDQGTPVPGSVSAQCTTTLAPVEPSLSTFVSTPSESSTVELGETVTDVADVTGDGAHGAVSGTMNFYLCGPGLGDVTPGVGCPVGTGTFVGQVAVETGNNGSSFEGHAELDYVTDTEGTFCFRAEYLPGVDANYLATTHTNADSECFEVVQSRVSVAKTPDGGAVVAGVDTAVSFDIAVANSGSADSDSIRVQDSLPPGNGTSVLDWDVTTNSGSAVNTDSEELCSVSGTPGSQAIDCLFFSIPAGVTYVIGVAAPISAPSDGNDGSCGVYANTATISEVTFDVAVVTQGSDSGSVTVRCEPGLTTAVDEADGVDDDVVQLGDTVADVATFAPRGTLGPLDGTGTVDFFLCGPTEAPAACASGSPAGSDLPISGNVATSDAVAPDAAGWWCFLAIYTPNGGSPYLTASENDSATECVEVLAPNLEGSKTVPGGGTSRTIDAGDDVEFTIAVTNTGAGIARGVTVDDPLPAPALLDWTMVSETSNLDPDVDACAIVGADTDEDRLACEARDVGAGDGSFSVTVRATSTAETCDILLNEAIVSAANAEALALVADTTVPCAPVLTTEPSAATVNDGDPLPVDRATLTERGNLGDVEGIVTFFLCGPDPDLGSPVSAAGCEGGTQVGDPVPVDTGGAAATVQSAQVPVNQANDNGTYCFRAVFAPTTNPNYLGAGHTAAAECFQRVSPGVALVKTVGSATVAAGTPLLFLITAANNGSGTAEDVVIGDDLPDGAGLVWSLQSQSVADLCAVGDVDAGAGVDYRLSCGGVDLAPANADPNVVDSFSVLVGASTTGASCGDYVNQAGFTSRNAGTGASNQVGVTVTCPPVTPPQELPDCDNTAFLDLRGITIETPTGDLTFSGEATIQELGLHLPEGCDIRLTFDGTLDGTAVSGSLTGYIAPFDGAALRAFQTSDVYALVIQVVESWNVPGVAPPAVPVTAVVTVTGPVVEVEAVGVSATLRVEPVIAFPLAASGTFVVTDVDVVPAELPNIGTGPLPTGPAASGLWAGALGLLLLLALAASQRQIRGGILAPSRVRTRRR